MTNHLPIFLEFPIRYHLVSCEGKSGKCARIYGYEWRPPLMVQYLKHYYLAPSAVKSSSLIVADREINGEISGEINEEISLTKTDKRNLP